MANDINIPLLSLIVAMLAVFVGPFISLLVAKKQIKNSLRITNKQIIAPIRQAWINELRTLLADISGKCAHYWASGYEEREDSDYQHITEAISKLSLYINPNEDEHIELLNIVQIMEKSLSLGGSIENDKSFWLAHEQTVKKSQIVLKKEWDRVKSEI